MYDSFRTVLLRFSMIFGLATVLTLIQLGFTGDITTEAIGVTFLYTFFYWEGNALFSCRAEKLFPSINDMPKKITLSIVFAFFYTMLVVAFVSWVIFGFDRSWQNFFGEFVAGFFITLLVSATYASVSFFKMYRNSLLQAESLKRSRMESELKALNAQVNPHFLFNSLNTLMSLIPEDPKLAVEFTRKFSDVYRYNLQNKNNELTTLRAELEFVRNYLFLLKIRHGEHIDLQVEAGDSELSKKIPSLTLQILIENAVKHNVISAGKKLTITVTAGADNKLVVRNNVNLKKTPETGTGTGLDNIRKRYEYLGAYAVEVSRTSDAFVVTLPLLEVEEYEMHHHRGRDSGR